MWTFTAYILWKLSRAKGSNKIRFSELVHFMFDILWKRYKMALNDSSKELEREVKYLEELGAVKFNESKEIIINENELKRIAQVVEHSSLKDQLVLYEEYLNRIKQAIEKDYKVMLRNIYTP